MMAHMHGETRACDRREWVTVAVVIGLCLLSHGFTMLQGIGEPDQVRLIDYGIYWHYTGDAHTTYFRVSPLYIHLVKKLVDWGCPITGIPAVLNALNVFSGCFALAVMYVLWRRLTNHLAALASIILAFFCPAFFVSTNYGMAHVPAFLFFVTSLLCFDVALQRSGRRYIGWMAVAYVGFMLTCGLKADLLLLGGAFPGLLILRRARGKLNLALAILIVPVGLAFVIGYSRWYAPGLGSTPAFAGHWFEWFPLTLRGLGQMEQLHVSIKTDGPAILGMGLISVVFFMRKRTRNWRLLAFAAAWCVPLALWWALRDLNVGRHMMAPFLIIPLLVGAMLYADGRQAWWKPSLLIVLLAANYFSYPAHESIDSPSTRVFHSAGLMQERLDFVRTAAEVVVSSESDKKATLGTWTGPYIFFHATAAAVEAEFVNLYLFRVRPGGTGSRKQLYSLIGCNSQEEAEARAQEIRQRGYAVFSLEYDLD